MHYFIDGYNLLFRQSQEWRNLQKQRESVIYELDKKVSILNLDVSIVFDAIHQPGHGSRSHYNSIEILFSAQGETADEFILNRLKNIYSPKSETIVTSDKGLARLSRHYHSKTMTIEEFTLWLDRCYLNKINKVKTGKSSSKPSKVYEKFETEISKDSPSNVIIPNQNTSLENCSNYYERIFEAEWQKILSSEREEQKKRQVIHSKRSVRKPLRKLIDPFPPPALDEPQTATEMDRWLKIFENKIIDSF